MAHAHLPEDLSKAVSRPPEAREMTVIAVAFTRGKGCCEEDPVRLVTAYYSTDGELLAEFDSWRPTAALVGAT